MVGCFEGAKLGCERSLQEMEGLLGMVWVACAISSRERVRWVRKERRLGG